VTTNTKPLANARGSELSHDRKVLSHDRKVLSHDRKVLSHDRKGVVTL
jgi:hypothetical protein